MQGRSESRAVYERDPTERHEHAVAADVQMKQRMVCSSLRTFIRNAANEHPSRREYH